MSTKKSNTIICFSLKKTIFRVKHETYLGLLIFKLRVLNMPKLPELLLLLLVLCLSKVPTVSAYTQNWILRLIIFNPGILTPFNVQNYAHDPIYRNLDIEKKNSARPREFKL